VSLWNVFDASIAKSTASDWPHSHLEDDRKSNKRNAPATPFDYFQIYTAEKLAMELEL